MECALASAHVRKLGLANCFTHEAVLRHKAGDEQYDTASMLQVHVKCLDTLVMPVKFPSNHRTVLQSTVRVESQASPADLCRRRYFKCLASLRAGAAISAQVSNQVSCIGGTPPIVCAWYAHGRLYPLDWSARQRGVPVLWRGRRRPQSSVCAHPWLVLARVSAQRLCKR